MLGRKQRGKVSEIQAIYDNTVTTIHTYTVYLCLLANASACTIKLWRTVEVLLGVQERSTRICFLNVLQTPITELYRCVQEPIGLLYTPNCMNQLLITLPVEVYMKNRVNARARKHNFLAKRVPDT